MYLSRLVDPESGTLSGTTVAFLSSGDAQWAAIEDGEILFNTACTHDIEEDDDDNTVCDMDFGIHFSSVAVPTFTPFDSPASSPTKAPIHAPTEAPAFQNPPRPTSLPLTLNQKNRDRSADVNTVSFSIILAVVLFLGVATVVTLAWGCNSKGKGDRLADDDELEAFEMSRGRLGSRKGLEADGSEETPEVELGRPAPYREGGTGTGGGSALKSRVPYSDSAKRGLQWKGAEVKAPFDEMRADSKGGRSTSTATERAEHIESVDLLDLTFDDQSGSM